MKKIMMLVLVVVIGLVMVSASFGAVPLKMSVQGKLTADDKTSPKSMTFGIYDVATGGTALWEETQSVALNDQGIFNAIIGGNPTPIPTSLSGPGFWMGIKIGAAELLPRQQLVSVPFAIAAGVADNVRTRGDNNIGIGDNSLSANTIGYQNTAIGINAGASNTTGGANTAIGAFSLNNNTTGSTNTATGHVSLYHNTTGSTNTAMGDYSLYENTTGNYNTAIGAVALDANTTGNYNTAIGRDSLGGNETGNYNTAVGYDNGGWGGSATNYCTFLGSKSGASGDYTNSTAIGYNAVVSRSNAMVLGGTIANGNAVSVGIGTQSPTATLEVIGDVKISGSLNASNLMWRLSGNTLYGTDEAIQSVGIGDHSLRSNTFGSANVGIGYYSLSSNTTGQSNIAIGSNALRVNTTGGANTAIGVNSLPANITGNFNTATGFNSLSTNTTGTYNTAVGRYAGEGIYTASYCTFLGSNSGATGDFTRVTAIGYNAKVAASNATAIGYNASVNSSNSTAIGYNAKVNSSNALVLGGTGADAVSVGIGTPEPTATLEVHGSTTNVSLKIKAGDAAGSDIFWAGVGGGTFPSWYQSPSGALLKLADKCGLAISSLGGENPGNVYVMDSLIGHNMRLEWVGSTIYCRANQTISNNGNPAGAGLWIDGSGIGLIVLPASVSKDQQFVLSSIMPFQVINDGRIYIKSSQSNAVNITNSSDNSTATLTSHDITWKRSGQTGVSITNSSGNDLSVSGGNVGIGVATSPAIKLNVDNGSQLTAISGTGYILGVAGNATYTNGIGVKGEGNTGVEGFGSAYGVQAICTSGDAGYGIYSSGRAGGTTPWNGTSDERLKKNIQILPNALENICKLNGVGFEWRQNEFKDKNLASGKQIGVIAQNVEKVYPEVVTTDKDGYKSVASASLVAPLIEAVKELKKENDALKARVNMLEEKVK